MGLINFKDIGLKPVNDKEVIKVNDNEITIVSYLPEDAKYDLIMITLQKSYKDGIYNPVLLNRYFILNIIYSYTGIVFADEDRADEAKLYDILYTNGIIDEVLEAMGPNELDDLTQLLNSTKEEMTKYNSSLGGFLSNTIEMLKEKLEDGMEMLKGIDMEKLQELLKNPQLVTLLGSGIDKILN
jgi:hypothetical protein